MKHYSRFFKDYMMKDKKLFYKALIFVTLSNLIVIINPLMIQKIIDNVIVAKQIDLLIPLFIGAALVNAVLIIINKYRFDFIMNLDANVPLSLNKDYICKLESLDLAYFKNSKIGDLINRSQKDFFQLTLTSAILTSYGFANFCKIIILLGVTLYLSVKLSFIALLSLPVYYFLKVYFEKIIYNKESEFKELDSDLTSFEQEVLNSVKTIKLTNSEKPILLKLKEKLRELKNRNIDKEKSSNISSFYVGILSYIMPMVIILSGGLLAINGSASIGEVLSFFYLSFELFNNLGGLMGRSKSLKKSDLIAKRVYEIMDLKPTIIQKEDAKELKNIKGEISFKNVSFHYDDNLPVLQNISFEIKENESVAFVGRSGEGKSTILDLILRFQDPVKGSINLDSYDLKNLTFASIRENISVVSQDIFLFHTTIIENFKLILPDVTDSEIVKSCQYANIHDFIETLPKKYETIIGEGGTKFSGGQRQRLAIARAIIQKPKIMIFDEATAHLDSDNEKKIISLIEENLRKCTKIYVAHRLSSIMNCDRIFCLENGKIAEVGSHQELLSRKGLYTKLWNEQKVGGGK